MIKLINRFGKFKRQLTQNQEDALNAMGKFGVKMMDKHAPLDTGLLMSRNTYVISRNELFLMNDCDYAIHQEFGTYKMRGTPFMRPAAGYKEQYKQIAAMYLGKGMK
jgi:HK97 gp10 family phage protein